MCKLDIHKKMTRRGYIAMLAVDDLYRRHQIGKVVVELENFSEITPMKYFCIFLEFYRILVYEISLLSKVCNTF